MTVAEAMLAYINAAQTKQDYLDRVGYDRLPDAGTLTRLGNIMRRAERAVDDAVIELVEERAADARQMDAWKEQV